MRKYMSTKDKSESAAAFALKHTVDIAVAYEYLVAEEWDTTDATISFIADTKDTRPKCSDCKHRGTHYDEGNDMQGHYTDYCTNPKFIKISIVNRECTYKTCSECRGAGGCGINANGFAPTIVKRGKDVVKHALR